MRGSEPAGRRQVNFTGNLMQYSTRIATAALFAATLLGGSSVAASAAELHPSDGADHAVFVQSNDVSHNQVLAYQRTDNGTLRLSGAYDAGGKGGRLSGAAVDPLASQGSLEYDRANQLLIGVNAGSDSIYAFDVQGNRLSNRQVLDSGGHFPVSIAKHGDLVYVLNAAGNGSLKGFTIRGGHLIPLADSTRSLGLTPVTDTTQFLNTPGQARFTPDGRQLIVTTKNNGSTIDVFGVGPDGRLTADAVRNPSATPVPFGISFDPLGRLVIAEAGASTVTTYTLRANGTLSTIGSVADGQAALCWIAPANGFFFGANAGSGSVSGFRVDASGHPTLVGTTSVGEGAIDLDASRGGQFLYVQLGGAGTINELKVNRDGSLTSLGTILGSPNMEGIVAI
jgi:6-phosphogluconolactonase (cycloisomerase 2 family)